MSDSAGQAAPSSTTGNRIRDRHRPARSLGRILEAALFLRVAAAVGLEGYLSRSLPGRICLFDDSGYYWLLAGTIRRGTLYEIMEWGDIPHFALRPPGYPIFLAGCRAALGDHPLSCRIVQAVLGMLTVWLVYRLARELTDEQDPLTDRESTHAWNLPLLAAALTAFHPYLIVNSVLLLSEAVFVPLMLLALWGTAAIWNDKWRMANDKWQMTNDEARVANDTARVANDKWRVANDKWQMTNDKGRMPDTGWRVTARELLIAFGVGLACGAAVLTRPSWGLFVPILMAAIGWKEWRGSGVAQARVVAALRALSLMALGVVVVMAPWWLRNGQIYAKFVPTALWMGASLYDGLNPDATGASNMKFLGAPDVWPLDELDQDRELTRRALAFARQEPLRVLQLALIKLGRYWCPWPNARGFRSPFVALASAVVMIPLLASMGLGLWHRRNDWRAWVLLAGPLLYFCLLHMVFASSMRYRIPAEAPALVLAAGGLARMFRS